MNERELSRFAQKLAMALWLMTVNAAPAQPACWCPGFPLWANRYNGPGNTHDPAAAVAVDGSGHVVVTGSSGISGSPSSYDFVTVAYSSAGVPLWTNLYNGPGNDSDHAYGIAVDGSGNVVVTGSSFSGSSYDYATVAYSSAGVPLWTISSGFSTRILFPRLPFPYCRTHRATVVVPEMPYFRRTSSKGNLLLQLPALTTF